MSSFLPEPLPVIDSAVVPRFASIATFMRTTAVTDYTDLEIALAGVPFDLGTLHRAGARQGPRQIRDMSSLIRGVHPVTHASPFSLCRIGDVGDAPVNPLDLLTSLKSIEDFFAKIHAAGAAPIAAGGDHSITLPILRAIAREQPVGLVHFDAHADTLDYVFSQEYRYNNATPFRRAAEEGLIDPKRCIQIGLRGSLYNDTDIEGSRELGMRVITIDEFFELGTEKVIAEARRIVGDGPTYITFDVDGLDPVYAPGTGVPEIGGFSTRDAQVMIRGLRGLNIVGGDVCEVCPPLDPLGNTAVVAANLMFEILCVLVDAIVQRRSLQTVSVPLAV